MNKQPKEERSFEQPMTTRQAIKALTDSAAALRKSDEITTSYAEGDPRPPRTVNRITWFCAANNLLDSGLLSKAERKQVQKLKMGMALSAKKK